PYYNKDIAIRHRKNIMVLACCISRNCVAPGNITIPIHFFNNAACSPTIQNWIVGITGAQQTSILQQVNCLSWPVGAAPAMNQLAAFINKVGIGGWNRRKEYISIKLPCFVGE